MQKKNFKKNIIIGAGIAGLTAAVKLKDSGKDFLLLEKEKDLGGSWDSRTYKDSIYEFGPNTILDKSEELRELIEKAQLQDEVISHKLKDSKRYFYKNSKFFEVSSNPFQLLSSKLLSFSAKTRLLLEPFIQSKAKKNESVHDFFSRRLGEEFTESIIGPALQGVWGGDIKQLNLEATMPKLYEFEQKFSSILLGFIFSKKNKANKKQTLSFKRGVQNLCNRLGDYISIEKLRTNTKVISIEKVSEIFKIDVIENGVEDTYFCEELYLASPAYVTERLVKSLNPNLSQALRRIFYAPIFLCAYSIKKSLFKDKSFFNAFGFLNSNKAHFTLGTIFASQVFKEREIDDEFLFVSFLGGSKNSQIIDFGKGDLKATALSEAKEILANGLSTNIELEDMNFIDSKLLNQAIPQYNDSYMQAKETILRELDQEPNLTVLGNFMNGVSITDTIAAASDSI